MYRKVPIREARTDEQVLLDKFLDAGPVVSKAFSLIKR